MTRPRVFAIAMALAGVLGCGPRTLDPGFDSSTALAEALLEAYRTGDREALVGLALSEEEFTDLVWPELPAARPERNLPLSYVWGDLHQKSLQSLNGLMARHRGRTLRLRSVGFEGETPYATYTVHRGAVLTVSSGDGTEEVRLCGSMIERQGRWKVFSFVVND